METIPSLIWPSGGLAITVCISAIVLSIQRGLYYKRLLQQEEQGGISLPTEDQPFKLTEDYKRDLGIPFADTNRLTRITYCSLILTALAAFDLHDIVTDSQNKPSTNIYSIVVSVIVLMSWLYASVLALVSRRYALPNVWGWVLNVHLCIIYCVAWIFALCCFWQAIVIGNSDMSWFECMPYLLPVLLGLDLIYVTITIKQGSPFLDEKGRQVVNLNVDSILGKLYFFWGTKVVRQVAAKKGEVTDQDLPPLTPMYRAHNIFYLFGATRGQGSLLSRLIKANASAFVLQIILAVFSSGLYYAPAFFMNRVLQFLQDMSDGVHYEYAMQHGALMVIGMGVSIVTLGIVVGQVWYYGTLMSITYPFTAY